MAKAKLPCEMTASQSQDQAFREAIANTLEALVKKTEQGFTLNLEEAHDVKALAASLRRGWIVNV
jgi:hypothetical protein